MKLLKVFSLSFFIFLSFLVAPVFAVVTAPATTKAPTQTAVLLATTSLTSTKIVSQNNNVFKISFTLKNGDGVQTGVKYGVRLENTDAFGLSTIDEKIFPESLTLFENSEISRYFTYEAPSTLSGKYNLVLYIKNISDFPLGTAVLGNVELNSTTSGLIILNSSCFLQVVGEKGEPHYLINQQIIDITKNENLRLTCNALNSTNGNISVTPNFETFLGTSYGTVAQQTGGDTNPIAFNAKETKSFSVVLPSVSIPQFYEANIKLFNNNISSNVIKVQYFLQGTLATILNLSLDKDSYKKGDTAILSFFYNLTQNNAKSNRIKNADNNLLSSILKASVVDEKGQECISPISKKVTQDSSKSITNISVPIEIDCINPKISATLSDDKGNILDQKNFLVTPNQIQLPETSSINNNLLLIILIIGILVVVGIAFYLIKLNKNKNEKIN